MKCSVRSLPTLALAWIDTFYAMGYAYEMKRSGSKRNARYTASFYAAAAIQPVSIWLIALIYQYNPGVGGKVVYLGIQIVTWFVVEKFYRKSGRTNLLARRGRGSVATRISWYGLLAATMALSLYGLKQMFGPK